MLTIDCDGHIEEPVAMFSYLEKEYYDRRPLPVSLDTDTVYGKGNAVWLIEGKAYHKPLGKGAVGIFGTPTTMELAKKKNVSIPAQEMTDVEARLRDLDQMGIDKQVIYPTLFLTTTTDDVKLEAALLRAYNSFLADACAKSRDRVKFAALIPIRAVDESIRELRRAKNLGAVSVMLLGVAWDKSLGDRELYPFYEEAANLEIPVCIHFGFGCPNITNTFGYVDMRFNSATLPVLMGFHSVVFSGLLDDIPRLRLAFLEVGSTWVPYVMYKLQKRLKHEGRGDSVVRYFKEGRIYVTCEADEDINYVTSWIGEDSLVMASDYPHTDPSHEEKMTEAIMQRDDVPLRVREKILSANAQRLYGI